MLAFNPTVGGDDAAVAVVNDTTWIYVVGYDESAGAGDFAWRVEKRSAYDGTPDTGFGTGGVYRSNPSSGNDRPTAVVHDGAALYVVGYDETAGTGDTRWRVEKLSLSSGALDATFGGATGVVTLDPAAGGDDRALAVTNDGTNLYVGGYDTSAGAGDAQWRVWAIDLSNGAAVTPFSSGGTRTWNPSVGPDAVRSLATDGTDLYVAGTDASPGGVGDEQWRVEKVALATGATVTAFGATGVVASNPSAGVERGMLVLDGTRVWLAGTVDRAGPDAAWRVEARATGDGSLQTGFASGGVLATNPTTGSDALHQLVVVNSERFALVGTDRGGAAGDTRWRIELRIR